MEDKLKHFESLFGLKNKELKELEESFRKVTELLTNSDRDQSRTGRINEFTRTIVMELFEFTGFINKVIIGDHEEINSYTLHYFEKKLLDASSEFKKLRKLINKMDGVKNEL